MKTISTIVAAGLLMAGAAGPGQPLAQHNLCYTACRIECQYLHQGDQTAIDQCYIQCAVDRCGAIDPRG